MDGIQEVAATIRHDDMRASQVIEHLRSLLKKVPFELKRVDVNEVVTEAIDLVSGQAVERKVDIRCTLAASPLYIMGDSIQLQQIVINLIVNAIDAMSDIPASERQIRIWSARRDKFAEVTVADIGPGIPPDKLKEVFQPFFTTKGHGMGLGLSIVRSIIEAHNGTISLESEVGEGAMFRIRLPLA
jgi:signal transduction histidine kinase